MLIERDDQLRDLFDLVEAGRRARNGQVAIVCGPVGSGRTELLRAVTEQARQAGTAVLQATCARAEKQLPLGVISQLLHGADLPNEVAKRADRLLAEGFERLARSPSPTGMPDGPTVTTLHALCLTLLDLAADRSLLITIDDLPDADQASRWGILHLARRISRARVALVLTGPAELVPQDPAFLAELVRLRNVHRLHLEPLSWHGVTQVARRRVDPDVALRLAPDWLRASGGSPPLVHALIADHLAGGDAGPAGYGPVFLGLLHRGDPLLLEVARGLAVLGECAGSTAVADLIRREPAVVAEAIQTLNTAGLLDAGRFRHPAARAVLLADQYLPNGDTDLQSRAAQLLHESGAAATTVAHHLVQAGQPVQTWAVRVLIEAAQQASLSGRREVAVECLELAGRGPVSAGERAALRARQAQVEWQLNPSAAARHLAPLTFAARADQLDRKDSLAVVRQLLWHGRTDDAVAVLDRIRTATARDPRDEAGADLRDVEQWLACTHPGLARRRYLPATPASQDTVIRPNADPRLCAVAGLADLLTRGRVGEAVEYAEQVLRELRAGRQTGWADEAALLSLQVIGYCDRAERSRVWCDRLLGELDQRSDPTWRAIITSARAEVELARGDLAGAVEHGDSALAELTVTSWGVAVGMPLATLVLATTRMGRHEEAARYLTHHVPDALPQTRYGLHYRYARGHHYLATNHAHAALADFLSCGELIRTWGMDVPGMVPWRTSAAEAWLRLGNSDQARRLVHEQLARPALDGTRTRALALRLLAATSPANRRVPLLTEAHDILEERGDQYEQARTLGDLSRTYFALDKNRRARMVFRRAWHLAAMCGAAPVTEELLAIQGEPVPAADDGRVDDAEGISSLTVSERRVASLAVMGYTNREIAGKLYITPSTVEQHLTHVYRKLNVKRRKELPVDLTAVARTG
jgi:DNA-binding CsgD family transcriptional regulator